RPGTPYVRRHSKHFGLSRSPRSLSRTSLIRIFQPSHTQNPEEGQEALAMKTVDTHGACLILAKPTGWRLSKCYPTACERKIFHHRSRRYSQPQVEGKTTP
ncbi:hypothetical protein BC936DRAFT_142772, partial [Jimgerdemannia flammicorona]